MAHVKGFDNLKARGQPDTRGSVERSCFSLSAGIYRSRPWRHGRGLRFIEKSLQISRELRLPDWQSMGLLQLDVGHRAREAALGQHYLSEAFDISRKVGDDDRRIDGERRSDERRIRSRAVAKSATG
jgi:hypothetical protein